LPELIERAVRPLHPPTGWDGHAAERLAESVAAALGAAEPAVALSGVHG